MAKVQPPSEFRVASSRIILSDQEFEDGRGVILLYEPPDPRARYVMGIDACQGRTGWSPYNRSDDDTDIDNGAIEIIRLGSGEPGTEGFRPDRQVAEFTAPIDPYDLARVANTMGRIYGGNNDEGQALCIVEVYPGPGGPCQRAMMETYGYTNMYRWQYLDTGMPSDRSKFDFGWYSTKQSMQHLWTRGLRLIHRKQLVFKSEYLVEEFANCEMDLVKMRGTAAGSGHDDRVTACLLALWAGHNWSFNIEPRPSRVITGPVGDWQSQDISSDRMANAWEEKWEEICREAEQGLA